VKITKTRLKQIIIEELLKEEEREGTVPELSPVRKVSADEILKKHWLDLGLFIDWLVIERKLPEAIDWRRRHATGIRVFDAAGRKFRWAVDAEKKIKEIITEFPIDIAPGKDCVEKLNLLNALPHAFTAAPTRAAIEKLNGRTLDWEEGPEESEPEESEPEESWKQRWTHSLRMRGLLPENKSGETPYQICKRNIEAYKQTQRDMGPFIASTSAEDADIAAQGAGISEGQLKQIIAEELTKTDKADIKKMISKELKDILEDELVKALKTSDIKSDIGEVAKKVIKKLYKDLSFHHPYIIDRIKV